MSICQHCGVELDDSATHCPLCRAAIRPSSSEPVESIYPERAHIIDDVESLSAPEKRKIFLEIFTVCSLVVGFVVIAIELIVDKRVWWSLYPIVSLAYLYLIVCVPLFLERHPWLVFSALGPASALFVLMIDLLGAGLSWFLPVGLPIVTIVEATVVACAVSVSISKRKGVNAIAIALLGAAAICVGIEIVLSLAFAHRINLSWSAVVATACLPLAGLLFYLHYRITKQASLKKLFGL